jgi:hypothetical protein
LIPEDKRFMALSIEDIGEVDQVVGDWCLARVPAHLKQSVDYDYEIDGQAVTILEVRPAWTLMASPNSPTSGHPKFPQAAPLDYDVSGVTTKRAAASLSL